MESPTHSVFFLWNWSRNLTRTEVQRPWFPQSWWELLWVQVGFTRSSVLSQILLFFFFLGPIASYFTNRFGCRLVTIAGAVLAAGGLALSCAAKSIVFLYFTVGILTGKIISDPFSERQKSVLQGWALVWSICQLLSASQFTLRRNGPSPRELQFAALGSEHL